MNSYTRAFISAILAGIMVALGGCVYLCLYEYSQIAAALFFSVGIMAIACLDLHLFIDRVAYLFTGDGKFSRRLITLFITLLGNIVGAVAVGVALSYKYIDRTVAVSLANDKLMRTPIDIIISSVFCGILIFVALHSYKRLSGGFSGAVVTVGAVSAFILCGFEDAISDIFYFSIANVNSVDAIVFILIAIFGNLIGASIFAIMYELKKPNNERSICRGAHRHHHRYSDGKSKTNDGEDGESKSECFE